ncbi:MAG: hypothetical protein ACQERN_07370 [Thermodesulfobacteriota bacterium]
MTKWIVEAGEKYSPDEMIKFLVENKEKVEEYIAHIDGSSRFYRIPDRMLSFFARLAAIADRISLRVQIFIGRVTGFHGLVERFRGWKNHLNFRELIEFVKTKLYSLQPPPHNEKAIALIEEIMEFAAAHGLDPHTHFPEAKRQLIEKKNQLLQHKFFREFSKSRIEQLLAIPFHFDRCIFPVLPDCAFWHKFFAYQERKKVTDLVLFCRNGTRVSLQHDDKTAVRSSEVVRILEKLSAIKQKGRRIFFVGHHEGYLGPYFVRSALRKLGFDNLTRNCNTIVGPRMFSNVVLRNGAANVGNLFVTVPSRKTTEIQTEGLAEALRKTAGKTQFLIKLPDAGLMLIDKLDYQAFISTMRELESSEFPPPCSLLPPEKAGELKAFLETQNFGDIMKELHQQDFDLFKNVMRESFLIFPEGSRSYTGPEGEVIMKYVNPKYIQAYMRPGDFIAPISLVGGSDLARGWRLRSAKLGLCMDEPLEVTADMIENYEEAGLHVMRKIAALPNLKTVIFDQPTAQKTCENQPSKIQ